jgi:hypothetical protein
MPAISLNVLSATELAHVTGAGLGAGADWQWVADQAMGAADWMNRNFDMNVVKQEVQRGQNVGNYWGAALGIGMGGVGGAIVGAPTGPGAVATTMAGMGAGYKTGMWAGPMAGSAAGAAIGLTKGWKGWKR